MIGPEVWIYSVGNELLIGRTVNTNASWLAKRLTMMGFRVKRVITLPDSIEDIVEELRRALGRADLVITTGGLGATYDDMTLAGVAAALGVELEINEDALKMLSEYYAKRGMELTEHRLKMAKMPKGAKALKNGAGAAPGCLIRYGKTTIISLPGVPREMEEMFEKEVVKEISPMAPPVAIVECQSTIRGVPESALAPHLERASKRKESIYVKSHPIGVIEGVPVVNIRVMASAEDRDAAAALSRETLEAVLEEAGKMGGRNDGVLCG